jgi:hypothetical protein
MPDERILRSLGTTIDTALQLAVQHNVPAVVHLLSMASLAISELTEHECAHREPQKQRG